MSAQSYRSQEGVRRTAREEIFQQYHLKVEKAFSLPFRKNAEQDASCTRSETLEVVINCGGVPRQKNRWGAGSEQV